MKKGFTILEIVVTIALTALIMIVIGNIFVSHNRVYRISQSQSDVQRDDSLALSRIKQLISETDKILANRTINGTAYTTGTTAIVLELPSFNASGSPIVGFDYAAIYVDMANPKKIYTDTQVTAGSKRPPGKKLLTDLNKTTIFRYNHTDPAQASAVTIYLKTSKIADVVNAESVASTTVYLQNK